VKKDQICGKIITHGEIQNTPEISVQLPEWKND